MTQKERDRRKGMVKKEKDEVKVNTSELILTNPLKVKYVEKNMLFCRLLVGGTFIKNVTYCPHRGNLTWRDEFGKKEIIIEIVKVTGECI